MTEPPPGPPSPPQSGTNPPPPTSPPSTLAPSDSASQRGGKGRGARGRGRGKGRTSASGTSAGISVSGVPTPKNLGGTPTASRNDPMYEEKFSYEGIASMHSVSTRPRFAVSFSGYIDLVYTTWVSMTATDTKLNGSLPFCLFQYYCVMALWYRMIKVHLGQSLRFQVYYDMDFVAAMDNLELNLPDPIRRYLMAFGTVTDASGETWLNVTYSQVGALSDTRTGGLYGHFNKMDEDTFWKYASIPAPAVSLWYIVMSMHHHRNNIPGTPWLLPDQLIPAALTGRTRRLTQNCLGYWDTFAISRQGNTVLSDLGFTNTRIPPQVNGMFGLLPQAMVYVSGQLAQKSINDRFLISRFEPKQVQGSLTQLALCIINSYPTDSDNIPLLAGSTEYELTSRFGFEPVLASASAVALFRRQFIDKKGHSDLSPLVHRLDAPPHTVIAPDNWDTVRMGDHATHEQGSALNVRRFTGGHIDRQPLLSTVLGRFQKSA